MVLLVISYLVLSQPRVSLGGKVKEIIVHYQDGETLTLNSSSPGFEKLLTSIEDVLSHLYGLAVCVFTKQHVELVKSESTYVEVVLDKPYNLTYITQNGVYYEYTDRLVIILQAKDKSEEGRVYSTVSGEYWGCFRIFPTWPWFQNLLNTVIELRK
ncbi:MAG: hypothetical protein LM589_00035 [Thermosphaera sp.]|nr:hypothetical protein [Thermosphaera sp.]